MKKSYFDLGRGLTMKEYEELKLWKAENPEMSWRNGDTNPATGLVFQSYERTRPNGERWTTITVFKETREKANKNNLIRARAAGAKPALTIFSYPLRKEPIITNKISFFEIGRILTKEEYSNLFDWIKENPSLRWNRNDEHPTREGLFFKCYAKRSINGESWITDETREKIQSQRVSRKELTAEQQRTRRRNFPEKSKDIQLRSRIKNIHKHRETSRNSIKKRTRENPAFLLKCRISGAIQRGMKLIRGRKTISTEKTLGCSFQEFRNYIEAQFAPWMNWGNYGLIGGRPASERNIRFEIDHIIPLSLAESEKDILFLNHYLNLRPLCAYENRYVKKDEPPLFEGTQEIINSILKAKSDKIIYDMQKNFSQNVLKSVSNFSN